MEVGAPPVRPAEELGYREVFHFEGGVEEWRQRGLPVVRPAREPRQG